MASIKAALQDLDPYEKPPESLRLLFKKLQKSSVSEEDADILDFSAGQANHGESVRTVGAMEAQDIRSVFNQFIDASEIADSFPTSERTTVRDSLIFEATDVPGGIQHLRHVKNRADCGRSDDFPVSSVF